MKRSHRSNHPGTRSLRLAIAEFALVTLTTAACAGSHDSGGAADPDSAATPAAAATTAAGAGNAGEIFAFTEADLDALQRGLAREIELVRVARTWQDTAKTPEERGRAAQAQFETSTAPEAAKAIGYPEDRYQRTREIVRRVLTTLDFQGKIDGPMELDTTRASAEAKERIRSDPFTDLPPESAAALRARLDQLVPVWIQYVRLTATAG